MFNRLILHYRKMAREINPECDFFFGFMCTNLPADMLDVELAIRMVKGYTYIIRTIWLSPPF